MGVRVAKEIFADRALNSDGTLVSRTQIGSVIHDVDVVVERSIRMITEGKVLTIDGYDLEVEADSLCLHGDTPGSVEMALLLKRGLGLAGIEIMKIGQML